MAKQDAKDLSIIPGGWSEERPADPHVQALCDSVKPEFKKRYKIDVETFKAVSYKYQVIAGRNYSVKVWVGGDQYWRLLIYEPLPCGEKPRLDDAFPVHPETDAIQH